MPKTRSQSEKDSAKNADENSPKKKATKKQTKKTPNVTESKSKSKRAKKNEMKENENSETDKKGLDILSSDDSSEEHSQTSGNASQLSPVGSELSDEIYEKLSCSTGDGDKMVNLLAQKRKYREEKAAKKVRSTEKKRKWEQKSEEFLQNYFKMVTLLKHHMQLKQFMPFDQIKDGTVVDLKYEHMEMFLKSILNKPESPENSHFMTSYVDQQKTSEKETIVQMVEHEKQLVDEKNEMHLKFLNEQEKSLKLIGFLTQLEKCKDSDKMMQCFKKEWLLLKKTIMPEHYEKQ